MDQRLQLLRHGTVVELRLNRPEKRNALDLDLLDALVAVAEDLKSDRSLRAVILSGAGEGFCAGLDTAEFLRMFQSLPQIKAQILGADKGAANRFQRPCTIWSELPVPVIAAIHGVCFGAGLQLALGADIRLAAPAARLSVMEARWGLIPDMGISQTLPHLIRADQAKDLIWSGREIPAPEAQAMGLVTRLCDDPVAEARAMAAGFAQTSPDVLRAGKALVTAAWGAAPEAALRIEAELQASLIGTANQIEAVMAGMEKRPPRFQD